VDIIFCTAERLANVRLVLNPCALLAVELVARVLVRSASLAGFEELPRREKRLEGRGAGAYDGHIDLDDGPEIHQNALLKGVRCERVRVDCVQADDGHDGREDADAKYAHQRDLLLAWSLDAQQGLDGQGKDDHVGYDVDA